MNIAHHVERASMLFPDKIALLNLQSVRYYFSAAASMPIEVAQNWRDRYGLVIHEGYGLTETSPYQKSYKQKSK